MLSEYPEMLRRCLAFVHGFCMKVWSAVCVTLALAYHQQHQNEDSQAKQQWQIRYWLDSVLEMLWKYVENTWLENFIRDTINFCIANEGIMNWLPIQNPQEKRHGLISFHEQLKSLKGKSEAAKEKESPIPCLQEKRDELPLNHEQAQVVTAEKIELPMQSLPEIRDGSISLAEQGAKGRESASPVQKFPGPQHHPLFNNQRVAANTVECPRQSLSEDEDELISLDDQAHGEGKRARESASAVQKLPGLQCHLLFNNQDVTAKKIECPRQSLPEDKESLISLNEHEHAWHAYVQAGKEIASASPMQQLPCQKYHPVSNESNQIPAISTNPLKSVPCQQGRRRQGKDLRSLLSSRTALAKVAQASLDSIMEDEEACGDCPTRVQISDFKIDKCQLQGSFASVYSCKHKSRRDELSMVRLAKRAYFQPPGAKREWDVIASSGHPNLVSLHWSFELESDFILITGFCDMGSLRQYIDKNGEPGLTVEETRDVGRNILDALHFLHGKRILHRDVHPTNVGICGPVDSTTAKLIDFGFAKRDQSGVVIGSPGYRAPELERRRNGAFRQSSRLFEETIDLYSFGILVFVTLVGNEATSSKGCVWQHEDFRKMLVDADHCLWHCDIYQDTGIFGLCQLADMEDCGAVATISALTETDPKSRTQTAALARELPFFQKEQDNFDDA